MEREDSVTAVSAQFELTAPVVSDIKWMVVRPEKGKDWLGHVKIRNPTHIHLSCYPYLWLIKQLIESASALQQIRIIPTYYDRLSENHLIAAGSRNVNLVSGLHRPESRWSTERCFNRAKFRKGQDFLRNLNPEQQKLWDEILRYRFREAIVTARYFCLHGEEYTAAKNIGQQYGYKASSAVSVIIQQIRGVLKYLDPELTVSLTAQEVARNLTRRMARIHKSKEQVREKRSLLRNTGVSDFPADLPEDSRVRFAKIARAYHKGRMTRIFGRIKNGEDLANILIVRYGLLSKQFLTFREAAPLIGHSWQCAQKREEVALERLGIFE